VVAAGKYWPSFDRAVAALGRGLDGIRSSAARDTCSVPARHGAYLVDIGGNFLQPATLTVATKKVVCR